MPEDFLPLHDFPPQNKHQNNRPPNTQHPHPSNFLVDYQNLQLLESLAKSQSLMPQNALMDFNHNAKLMHSASGASALGTPDYTKIVQALETLKSGNIIASTPPKSTKFESTLELEPVSPCRDDKKKKKKKKHKDEKKKGIKKK